MAAAEFYLELTPTSAKAATAAVATGRTDMFVVPRKKLRIIDGFNVRDLTTPENKAHVAELAQSMISEGWWKDKPVAGYAGKDGKKDVIYVTDGHCRLAAAEIAAQAGVDIENVPVVLKPPSTTVEDLMVAMARGNTGKRLSPIELAEVCHRLLSRGVEAKEAARRLGITTVYLNSLQVLRSAPAKIRKMVETGKLSATEAVKQIKEKGEEAVAALEEGLKRAEEAGKAKVTAKHVDAPKKERKTGDKVRHDHTVTGTGRGTKEVEVFTLKAGERLEMEAIASVKNLAGGDWWTLNEEAGKIDILTDIRIEVRVKKGVVPAIEDPALQGL